MSNNDEQVAAEVVLRTVGVYHPHHTVKLKRDLPHGTKLYTRPQPAVNQQAIEVIQDCIAMGYLVDTVDSSPTHRALVKKARAAIAAAQEQSK